MTLLMVVTLLVLFAFSWMVVSIADMIINAILSALEKIFHRSDE